jgi:hypothetical protein
MRGQDAIAGVGIPRRYPRLAPHRTWLGSVSVLVCSTRASCRRCTFCGPERHAPVSCWTRIATPQFLARRTRQAGLRANSRQQHRARGIARRQRTGRLAARARLTTATAEPLCSASCSCSLMGRLLRTHAANVASPFAYIDTQRCTRMAAHALHPRPSRAAPVPWGRVVRAVREDGQVLQLRAQRHGRGLHEQVRIALLREGPASRTAGLTAQRTARSATPLAAQPRWIRAPVPWRQAHRGQGQHGHAVHQLEPVHDALRGEERGLAVTRAVHARASVLCGRRREASARGLDVTQDSGGAGHGVAAARRGDCRVRPTALSAQRATVWSGASRVPDPRTRAALLHGAAAGACPAKVRPHAHLSRGEGGHQVHVGRAESAHVLVRHQLLHLRAAEPDKPALRCNTPACARGDGGGRGLRGARTRRRGLWTRVRAGGPGSALRPARTATPGALAVRRDKVRRA